MSKRKPRQQQKLKTAQIEEISAYLDGELSPEQSARTAERIRHENTWSRTARSFEQVDTIMEAWQAAPLRRDLTASILAKAHERPARPAWLRVAGPLAAAAAILLVVMLYQVVSPPADNSRIGPTAGAPAVQQRPTEEVVMAGLPKEDRFVVENLDVIKDLPVLANFETLEAIDRLARNGDI